MQHVVIAVDLVGSTKTMADRGVESTGREIEERLTSIRRQFEAADSTAHLVGSVQGDGMLLTAHDPMTAVVTAVRLQAIYPRLPARIVVGVGYLQQDGDTYRGSILNLVSKLLGVCPPGGVVLTLGLSDYLLDHPVIRARLGRRGVPIQGFGHVEYWFVNGEDELRRRRNRRQRFFPGRRWKDHVNWWGARLLALVEVLRGVGFLLREFFFR